MNQPQDEKQEEQLPLNFEDLLEEVRARLFNHKQFMEELI